MRKVILQPRKREVYYNQLNIKTRDSNNKKEHKTSSPVFVERKNLTPIYGNRRQIINNNNKNINNKNNKNENINNINTIYSYNLKEKNIFLNNNNNYNTNNSNDISITTEEKNIFEDLLSEETKNTENSINSKEKEKDNNINNNSNNIITPRFNQNQKKEEVDKKDN